jgi:hypothetical protein
LNLRPPGYEPGELPDCSTPRRGRHYSNAIFCAFAYPRLSGPALADRLVAEEPSLKVLFRSGYTEEATDGNGTLRPGTHILQKPFTATTFSQKVRNVLDGRAPALVG